MGGSNSRPPSPPPPPPFRLGTGTQLKRRLLITGGAQRKIVILGHEGCGKTQLLNGFAHVLDSDPEGPLEATLSSMSSGPGVRVLMPGPDGCREWYQRFIDVFPATVGNDGRLTAECATAFRAVLRGVAVGTLRTALVGPAAVAPVAGQSADAVIVVVDLEKYEVANNAQAHYRASVTNLISFMKMEGLQDYCDLLVFVFGNGTFCKL
jgi:energy-coupling factor transporter ATP-binding protein EcfA2